MIAKAEKYFDDLTQYVQDVFIKHKTIIIYSFIYTFIIGIIAHGFMYFNPAFSHDSLTIVAREYDRWDVSLGRFFIPYMRYLTGDHTVTWLIGIHSLFWVALSTVFTCVLLKQSSKAFVFIVSSLYVVNIPLILVNATYIFQAAHNMGALFLGIVAVYAASSKNRYVISLAPIAIFLCMGLYQAYINIVTGLMTILVLIRCINNEDVVETIKIALKYALILLVGAVLYLILSKVSREVWNASVPTGYWGLHKLGDYSEISLFSAIKNTYASFFKYTFGASTFNNSMCLFAKIFIVFTSIPMLVIKLKKARKINIVFCVILIALIPFSFNFTNVISKNVLHYLMTFSFSLLIVFCCHIIFSYKHKLSKIHIAVSCFLILIMTINGTIFSNTVYLKKYNEHINTVSHVSRILDRIETSSNFDYKNTVCYIERIDRNEYLASNRGLFKSHFNFTGLGETLSTSFCQDRFIRNLSLRIKVKELNENTIKGIHGISASMLEEINSMPPYPHINSVKTFGNILIVKMTKNKYKIE
ncbi:glucosyltransferase domain-containing protein [Mailhella sp.]